MSAPAEPATRRTALVTGGSRGIGAATCVALAADGWDVVLTYRSAADEAAAVVEACEALGARTLAVAGDVSVEADVDAVFAALDEAVAGGFGRFTALVNNAGVVSPAGPVSSYDAQRLERVLAVNVVGAFLVAGRAVRRLARSAGGSGGVVVNVSSRAAVLGSAGEYVDYAASKAAVDALTTGLAGEVAADGIRVVGVRPGLIETQIHEPGRLDRLGSTPPLGRPGTAEEVATTIAFLASDAASYVTGTTLDVSGGR